jgi:hypothetical protein
MRIHAFAVFLMLPLLFAANFSISPLLYPSEKNASITYASFVAGNTTAKIVKLNGQEILVLANESLVLDNATIGELLAAYYKENFYPSQQDMEELKGFADAFNASRNAQTKFGPAEKVCFEQGTLLAAKPCDDLASCSVTASLICTLSGAQGCTADLLATHILSYSKQVKSLNDAYSSFMAAYSGFSPTTAAQSLDQMNAAFDKMKAAADEISKSKLIFPETYSCSDCLGICPQPRFNYQAISAGKEKVQQIRQKIGPFANLSFAVERVKLSTQQRIAYKEGEEKASIYGPRYEASKAKFAGLKAKAVSAKLLVSDSDFTSVADSFINKSDMLDDAFAKRKFEGFDALLLSYERDGNSLLGMINNSTDAYYRAAEAQDEASDLVLRAMWRAQNGKSPQQYNELAQRKNSLDKNFSPPMTRTQYDLLATQYRQLSSDIKKYLSSPSSIAEPLAAATNKFEAASIDGAMTLASSIGPMSFGTRQAIAKYIPFVVFAAFDMAALAVILAAIAFVFSRLHLKGKLALSGGALFAAGAIFLILGASAGFLYFSTFSERYSSFEDFESALKASDKAAIIVRQAGSQGMVACASQIESQLGKLGKKAIIYYIEGQKCTKEENGKNSSLSANSCLNSIPDIPVFDLRYSSSAQNPTFTSAVAKQAIVSGNEDYFGKKPMCDIANVLG